MPTEGPERILVGVIAKPHGLRGEVVVDVLSDAPERFAPGSALRASLARGGSRQVTVEESRPFGARLLVRLEGIGTREEAEALHGAELTIGADEVAPLPEGRYYRFQLVGLRVETTRGTHLGEVTDVFATGSNDVIVVRGGTGEVLIPILPGVVVSVDADGKAMTVAPPPGLPGIAEEE